MITGTTITVDGGANAAMWRRIFVTLPTTYYNRID